MKILKFIFPVLMMFSFSSCSAQFDLQKTVGTVTDVLKSGDGKLTTDEVIAGLKEALSVGTNNSTKLASKFDGYYKNPLVFIPFPPEAREVETRVRQLGLNKQVDDFVRTLNRAAEEAAKEAAPIFLNAVKQMTIQDGWAILKGSNREATNYLKSKTSAELYTLFKPVVERAINKVQLTKAWEPVVNTYNKIPLVKKQNPDLKDYTTKKAIEGLFIFVGKEEEKIRQDPGARVTDLLKKVFGQVK